MSLQQKLQMKRKEILEAAERNGASNLRIFGSVARGEDRPGSDVDFLVEMARGRSLKDLSLLLQDLEDLLQCKVHVVDTESLHWYIRDKILEEAKPL